VGEIGIGGWGQGENFRGIEDTKLSMREIMRILL